MRGFAKFALALVVGFAGTAVAQDKGSDVGQKAEDLSEETGEKAQSVGEESKNSLQELGDSISGGENLGDLKKGGNVDNQVIVDPIGMATGDGLNVQYGRPLGPRWNKWMPLAYAKYSQTDVPGGDVGNLGLNVGMDYFIYGAHGEGFRVGPRVGVIGAFDTQDDNSYAVGGLLGGETGYTFVATNGITAAGGIGLEFSGAGRFGDDSGWEGDSNPYARLQLGYSW